MRGGADGVSARRKESLVEAPLRVGELRYGDAGLLVCELDARARDGLAGAAVCDRTLERACDGVLRRRAARGRTQNDECEQAGGERARKGVQSGEHARFLFSESKILTGRIVAEMMNAAV